MVTKPKRARKKTALPAGSAPARRGSWWLVLVIGALVLVNLYVFVWRKGTSVPAIAAQAQNASIPGGNALATPDAAVAETALVEPRTVEGKVESGDSMGKILRRVGVEGADASEVMRALRPLMDFRAIRPGQTYRLERDAKGRIQHFEFVLSKTQKVKASRNAAGEFTGDANTQATRIEVREFSAKIDSSLYASIKGAGEFTSLIAFFVDVFAYDIDFYNDTHAGDLVQVVVEKEYVGDEFLRYRRILAATYQGKVGEFGAYYWQSPGAKSGKYFTERGESLEKTMLKTPLKYARVSSKFDRKRMHPVLHREKAHLGIDYAAPTGTPVWAAAAGRVSHRAPSGGAGNLIVIQHAGGISTLYMHLSKFAKGIKVGDNIEAKTVIGAVGTTGLSTGPHLHFGVKLNGAYVDPSKLTPQRGAGVPKKELAAFKTSAAALAKRLAAAPMIKKVDSNGADDDGDSDDDAVEGDDDTATSATGVAGVGSQTAHR